MVPGERFKARMKAQMSEMAINKATRNALLPSIGRCGLDLPSALIKLAVIQIAFSRPFLRPVQRMKRNLQTGSPASGTRIYGGTVTAIHRWLSPYFPALELFQACWLR